MRKRFDFASTKLLLKFIYLTALTASFYSFAMQENNYDDFEEDKVIVQLARLYQASMDYIFANQALINSNDTDKQILFGNIFINNIKSSYIKRYGDHWPVIDRQPFLSLIQAMIEVMEDNRTLLLDSDIAYKGFIPAVFAFQLSEKMLAKGLDVKIKFTNLKSLIRNAHNSPDEWESLSMKEIQKTGSKSVLDDSAIFHDEPVVRYLLAVELVPFCLTCHGRPQDNPLNLNKAEANWTQQDISGFLMENLKLGDFAGGISVVLKKDAIKHQ